MSKPRMQSVCVSPPNGIFLRGHVACGRAGEVMTSLAYARQGLPRGGTGKEPNLSDSSQGLRPLLSCPPPTECGKRRNAHLATVSYRNGYDCNAAGALASAHTRHRHH